MVRFIKILIYFREIAETRCPEVLFRGYHVTHLPNEEYKKWDELPLFDEDRGLRLRDFPVEVKRLCHVTHNQEARRIDQGDHFIFKPNKKVGKAGYSNYDGSPVGETFVICEPTDQPPTNDTEYRYIDPNDPDNRVFPGYYIWWSIDHPPPPQRYYFSHFFTSSSRYGNVKFSGYIKQLLRCYQEAYNKVNPLPRVQFRCGGTLRYKNEICKVVIVCTEIHYPEPKDDFPVMWEGHDIKYNKDIGGRITNVKPLDVVIRNIVSNKNGKSYSWDTYAFAFYFPGDTYELLCPRSEKFERSKVYHNDKLCTKTQPDPNKGGKFICPNNLPSQGDIESDEEEYVSPKKRRIEDI